MTFPDEELARAKGSLVNQGPKILSKEKLEALIARLEAAEQVIVDIAYPDHGFFNEIGFRKAHFDAWRKAAGK